MTSNYLGADNTIRPTTYEYDLPYVPKNTRKTSSYTS